MLKIILSPAKSLKEQAATSVLKATSANYVSKAAHLVDHLKELDANSLKELFKVSDKIAHLNWDRFQEWDSKNMDNAPMAGYQFDGDAYKELEFHLLPTEQQAYLQNNLYILSGLYGFLRPTDAMLPYRLEMGTKGPFGEYKNLYAFWQETLTERLHEEKVDTIINVASNEYSKAIDQKKFKGRWIECVFAEMRDGKPKIISFSAKRARGMMTRYMAENEISNPELIKNFDKGNYAFDPSLSDENKWVFIR